MEIEIPDDKVVLSDFDSWHFVLNKVYLNTKCYNEEIYEKDCEWIDSLGLKERKEIIEKSWDGIFDLTPLENNWMWRGKYIQATFWSLKKEQVKRIWFHKER